MDHDPGDGGVREAGEIAAAGDAAGLTALERDVLAASATGLAVIEVADALDVAPDQIRRTLASAIKKLGARSKLEAVIIALRRGLIDIPRDPDAS